MKEPPPCPSNGIHLWILGATRRLENLSDQEIFSRVYALTRNVRRPVHDSEIWDAIAKVRDTPTNELASARPTRESEWPLVDLKRIDHIVSSGIQLSDLWDLNPYQLTETPGSKVDEIIDIIFPSNVLLCCGFDQSHFATRCRETWRGQLHRYALIVPSPMIDVVGITQKGHLSEHSRQAVGLRCYLVVEFDIQEFNDKGNETIWAPLIRKWRECGVTIHDASAALLWHLSSYERLTMVVHSGGKSLHGWFHALGRPEKMLFDFMRLAVRYGADRAHWTNPSQFARMPEGTRDSNTPQPVYYLDPQNAVLSRTPSHGDETYQSLGQQAT